MFAKPFLEKTELSEIAPHPSKATLNLLKKIYADNGPVQNVYKKYGVTYHDTDFITVINGELWVDKNKEIQGLLPAYKYSEKHKPQFQKWSLFWPTLKNFWKLNTIRTNHFQALFHNLQAAVIEEVPIHSVTEAYAKFLTQYEIIFEINLLSGLALKKLERLLTTEPITFLDIVSGEADFIHRNDYHVVCPTNMIGNSLELTDTSKFLAPTVFVSNHNPQVTAWWHSLSPFKQKLYHDPIVEALVYNHLRELGRWLTVKNKTILRTALLQNGEFLNSNHSTVPENNQIPIEQKSKLISLSKGKATGTLATAQEIDSKKYSGPIILYTEMLAPDLTRYFDRVVGVLSARGSLLSHLAIVAREQHIPMITGFYLGENGKIGDTLTMDAHATTITQL